MRFVYLFLPIFVKASQCLDVPKVTLPQGVLEGFYKHSVKGNVIYSFEGVPYAEPPIGLLRFQEPKPAKPWKGIWKANTMFACMQLYHYTPPGQDMVTGDEDCLYLNIYSPDLHPSEKMDVLVYIHGGAFMFNKGGIHGPHLIVDRNIVYVNLNYRLGPLGFLSTEDDLVPGNMGLRDQQMALKWVNENIHHFGGNPDSVTIVGNSAGGASVQMHLLAPSSKGLFHKGYSQSGCALSNWALVEKPLEKTLKLANLTGCPTDRMKNTVDCLMNRPARQIVGAVKHFQPWLYNPFTVFGPVVDTWGISPFFPDHPFNLLKEKKVQDLPWMISYVSGEGLYPGADFFHDDKLKYLEENWNDVLPYILHYMDVSDPKDRHLVGQHIRKEYLGDKILDKTLYSKLIQAITDRLFVTDIEKAGKRHAAAVSFPVYSYIFNYRGANSLTELRTNSKENIGVSHADDNTYMFKRGTIDTMTTEADRNMTGIMIEILASFVKNGKPDLNIEWKPLYKDIEKPWRQLRIEGPKRLILEEKHDIGNKVFWDSLKFKENEHVCEM